MLEAPVILAPLCLGFSVVYLQLALNDATMQATPTIGNHAVRSTPTLVERVALRPAVPSPARFQKCALMFASRPLNAGSFCRSATKPTLHGLCGVRRQSEAATALCLEGSFGPTNCISSARPVPTGTKDLSPPIYRWDKRLGGRSPARDERGAGQIWKSRLFLSSLTGLFGLLLSPTNR